MAEANEPPNLAEQREIREELGLDMTVGRLVVLDWVSPHGPWGDLLAFIFDGGELDDDQIVGLAPRDGELARFAFFTEEQAQQRLRPYVWGRISSAINALAGGYAEYLQDGYGFPQSTRNGRSS